MLSNKNKFGYREGEIFLEDCCHRKSGTVAEGVVGERIIATVRRMFPLRSIKEFSFIGRGKQS